MGIRVILPQAEVAGECENQLLRNLMLWGRGWGGGGVGSVSEAPAALPGHTGRREPTEKSRRQVRKLGTGPVTGLSRRQMAPSLEPGPAPAKAKGTWQEKALWGSEGVMGVGRCLCPGPRQALPRAQTRPRRMCREGRGQPWGEGERPFLCVSRPVKEGNTGEARKMAADAGHRPWGPEEPGAEEGRSSGRPRSKLNRLAPSHSTRGQGGGERRWEGVGQMIQSRRMLGKILKQPVRRKAGGCGDRGQRRRGKDTR